MTRPISCLRLLALVSLAIYSASYAAADVPTDAQVTDAADWYQANGKRILDGIPDPRLADVLKNISLAEMTMSQVRQFNHAGILAQLDETQSASIRGRLIELAKSNDAAGADAAVLQLRVTQHIQRSMSPQEQSAIRHQETTVVRNAINHPGLPDLLSQKRGFDVFLYVYFQRAEMVKDARALQTLARLVDAFDGVGNIRSLLAFEEVACDAASPLTDPEKQAVSACAKRNLEVALRDASLPAAERKYLSGQMDQLLGAAANGKLIGYSAPHIDFLWTTGPAGGADVKDFSAFRGKVVVMDYWATWCVPCIGGFPRMRQLREKYTDAPVVLLGVTSLQGRMTFPYNKALAPVRNLTESHEIELLQDWARGMQMTWTVACSQQDCFNPDFGIRSIPHVAIMDAKGIVRYNGLDIDDPSLETKIGDLVREAGEFHH